MTRCTRLLLCSLLVVAALTGCRNQKPDAQAHQNRSGDDIYQLASRVSEQADVIIVVRNISEALTRLKSHDAFDLVDSDVPREAVGRILAGSLGFDPQNPRAWRSKGVRIDAPLIVVFVSDDPVVLLSLDDEATFEAYMDNQSWAHEKVRTRRDPYLRNAQSSGDSNEPDRVPTWKIHDGVACVSLFGRKRDVQKVCRGADAFSEGSIVQSRDFLRFRDAMMDEADVGMFAPTFNRILFEEMIRGLERTDTFAYPIIVRAMSEAEGFGLTGQLESDSIQMRARLGLSDHGVREVGELLADTSVTDLDGLVAPGSVAAVRIAANPTVAWSWLTRSLHWEARTELRDDMSELRDALDREFDLRADLIEQLGGEVILLVQHVPEPASSNPGAHRRQILFEDNTAFSFVIPFKDPVAPPQLLGRLESLMENDSAPSSISVSTRGGASDAEITVAEFKNRRLPNIYIYRDRVMIAPTALPFDHVQKSLFGTHEPADSTGAKAFVRSRGAASGFLNFQALFDLLGRERAEDNLGVVAGRMRHLKATIGIEDRALAAEGEWVDASALRIFSTSLLRSRVRDWTERPKFRLRHYAARAQRYYQRPQSVCQNPDRCREPWHAGTSGGITSDKMTFPGGLNQRLATHPSPPTAGRIESTDLEARQFERQSLEILGMTNLDSSRFQYVYQTNGVSGPGAKFIIEAVADLDPTSPEKHTYVISGEVNKSGHVRLSNIEERHRFE